MYDVRRMAKTRVLILGAGKIGRALGGAMRRNGADPSFWDKIPGAVPRQKPLAALVPPAAAVFFCLPSWCLREAAESVAAHLRRGVPVVAVSKGLEAGTLLPAGGILNQVLPGAPFVFLGGPLLADEILKGRPGVGVAASTDRAALASVARLFVGTKLRVEISDDASGVVWSAVLKNVYALGLGMAEGIGWGANMRGWLVAKAAEEAGGILEDLGGRRETFHGTAGIGDLVATGFSPRSKNRSAGEAIARKGKSPHVSEGMASLPQLLAVLGPRSRKYPLLTIIASVVVGRKKARRAFEKLLH